MYGIVSLRRYESVSGLLLMQQIRLAADFRSGLSVGDPCDLDESQVPAHLAKQPEDRRTTYSMDWRYRHQLCGRTGHEGPIREAAGIGEGELEHHGLIFDSLEVSKICHLSDRSRLSVECVHAIEPRVILDAPRNFCVRSVFTQTQYC